MKKNEVIIAPSILAANPLELKSEIKKVEDAGGKWVHIDIMDGHFVPNLSFSPDTVKALRKVTGIFFDVHLMISEPEKYIEKFYNSGADLITVHLETVDNPELIAEKIHLLGIKAGISVKPGTSFDKLEKFIKFYDLVLIMTVEPGFGGQSYIEDMNEKIKACRDYIDKSGLECYLEVDGGIKPENIYMPFENGADVFVAGSSFFNAENPQNAFLKMCSVAQND